MELQKSMVSKWLSIAQQNVWIRQRGSKDPNDMCAFEDSLTEQDFFQCYTIEELYDRLTLGNWKLKEKVRKGHRIFLFDRLKPVTVDEIEQNKDMLWK